MKNKIKRHKYTEEENEFIRKYHEGLSGKELTNLFNQKFDTDISVNELISHKIIRLKLKVANRVAWNKGLKGWQKVKPKHLFKKGNLPKHTQPIGSERINSYGLVIVKVANPKVWKLKHHVIYEKYHGEKLGKRDRVIFLDGNNRNFDISNLQKISNSEQSFLANTNLLGNNPENNKTALLLAKLVSTVKILEKSEVIKK